MSVKGGYGDEAWGDPFGAGGPLHVVRAVAVSSHVVRVVFDETPLTRSAAGATDARNPGNYLFAVVDGDASAPIPVGVDREPLVGPVYGVESGDERGMDVHVDRALAIGVTYNVEAVNIVAALGGALASPSDADFLGVTPLGIGDPPKRSDALIDIGNPLGVGHYQVDSSGDIIPDASALASLKKRVIRRITTDKHAFSHLPGYGARLAVKEVASLAELDSYRADLLQQIRREPDVLDAAVSIRLLPQGVVTFSVAVQAKLGDVTIAGRVDPETDAISFGG